MNQNNLNGWSLTALEQEDYAKNGLVVPAVRLSSDDVADLCKLLTETLAKTPGQRPETLVCPHIEGMNGLPREITDKWLAVCQRPEFLDLVSNLIGDDMMLWGSQLFCKPPRTGLEVPWHQDGHFWPIEPLATCTLWLAIDNVDAENGAMLYVPGSHLAAQLFAHAEQPSEESALNAEMLSSEVDLDRVEVDELPAGAFSLHDVYLVHGSKPNLSDRRRAGFVVRYMPTSSHYDRASARCGSNHVATNLADRPLFLLRGEDHTDKTGVYDLRK
tara:strand:+ start:3203 stop:4021 length:819 start_codon:yes stop_codon:yes gene_type:complete